MDENANVTDFALQKLDAGDCIFQTGDENKGARHFGVANGAVQDCFV